MLGDNVSVHRRRNPCRSRSVGVNLPPGIEISLPPLIPTNTSKIEQSQSMMSFRLTLSHFCWVGVGWGGGGFPIPAQPNREDWESVNYGFVLLTLTKCQISEFISDQNYQPLMNDKLNWFFLNHANIHEHPRSLDYLGLMIGIWANLGLDYAIFFPIFCPPLILSVMWMNVALLWFFTAQVWGW